MQILCKIAAAITILEQNTGENCMVPPDLCKNISLHSIMFSYGWYCVVVLHVMLGLTQVSVTLASEGNHYLQGYKDQVFECLTDALSHNFPK